MKKIFLVIVLVLLNRISFSQVYYGLLDEDKTNPTELAMQKDNARITKVESELGKKMGMVMIFMWYPQDIDVAGCNDLIARGITPILSLEAGMSFTSIISGTYDAYFNKFADQLKQINGTVMLRYNHEMNGNWYSWSGSSNGANTTATANYIAAWKRVHGIIKTQKGATNVLWNWSVNAGSFPDEAWNQPMNYYPGDEYVDWIGFDSYDKPYNYTPTRYKSVDDIFGTIYNILKNGVPNKPMLVGEFASENDGRESDPHKLDFFSQGSNLFDKYPQIHAFSYFNSKKENSGRFNNYKYNNPIECLSVFKTNWISNVNIVSGSLGIDLVHKHKILPETGMLKIEAEQYFDHNGIKNEVCSEGGLNAGSAVVGDYMDYLIEAKAGTYTCNLRLASGVTTGKIEIRNQSGVILASHTQLQSTGGVQVYETKTMNIALAAGKQKLRIYHAGSGVNINWFEIGNVVSTTQIITSTNSSVSQEIKPATVYSNPTDGIITITAEIVKASKVSVLIYDMAGRLHLSKEYPKTNGHFENSIDITSLPAGTYNIKIEKLDGIESLKVMKK